MNGNYLNDINEAYQQSLTALNNLKDLCENEGKRGEDLATQSRKAANLLKRKKADLNKINKKHNEHIEKHKMLSKISDIKSKTKETDENIRAVKNSTNIIRCDHPFIEMLSI